ncbi:hypothetical protein TrST_g10638 [Triparma strigata]|uniref:Myb-like domain-containing protein n=1 Tax=Triparma strigata TaxID=1606541 RepID=A0A9W7EK46_9STRA|nr:hypothetical protein TrST_g10638 [Triparma strigata]
MNAVKQEESNMIDIDVKIEYLMDIKREEGNFDELNEEGGGVGGDDVGGGGGVVVKEEEVEEVVEEEFVGVKRKAVEEETKPKKTKKKRGGKGKPAWTEEEDDELLKGAGKYGLDFKRIKKDNDGNVLADRTPDALRERFKRNNPEKFKELRAATPRKGTPWWTAEEVEALKRGFKKYGIDWDEIHKSENKVLGRRTPVALEQRYHKHLNKIKK